MLLGLVKREIRGSFIFKVISYLNLYLTIFQVNKSVSKNYAVNYFYALTFGIRALYWSLS